MKKTIALLLALLVCINCMPVFAVEPQTPSEPVLPDPKAYTLFAGADFSRDELSSLSVSDFQLTAEEKRICTELETGLKAIFEDHLMEDYITVAVDGWELLFEDMGAAAPYTQEEADLLAEVFMQRIMELHPLDLNRVLFQLTADCPLELFFMDKYQAGMYAVPSIVLNDDNTGWCLSSWEFSFTAESVYADPTDSDRFTLNEAAHTAYQQAKANALAIIDAHKDEGDLEKLCSYRDAICDLVTYDHDAADWGPAAGSGPWNIVHVFDGDENTNVVCEGYAKAFQYLMQNSSFRALDIRSLYVIGIMSDDEESQPHGWNNVIIDGKVYLADVTNSDEDSIGNNGGLFLAGAQADENGVYSLSVSGENIFYAYDPDTTLAVYNEQQLAYEKESLNLQEVCSHVNSDLTNDILYVEPTCRSKGIYIQICDLCGQQMEEFRYVREVSHDYTAFGPELNPATCLAAAVYRAKCRWCDALGSGLIYGEALGHDYHPIRLLEGATCQHPARYYMVCSRCNTENRELTEEIGDRADHWFTQQFGMDEVFQNQSCTSGEIRLAKCFWCDETQGYPSSRPLDPQYGNYTSYTWSEDLSTCTAESLCNYCQGSADGHRLKETVETSVEYNILDSKKYIFAYFSDSRIDSQMKVAPMTDDELIEQGIELFYSFVFSLSGYFEPYGTFDIPEKKSDFDEDTVYVSQKNGADIYPGYYYMRAEEYNSMVSRAAKVINAILDRVPSDCEEFDPAYITRDEALELKSLALALPESIRTDGTRTNDAGASSIVSLNELSVEFAGQLEYTGKAVVQPQEALIVCLGEKILQFKTDYAVSYKNNKTVGKASMIITLKGEYKNMGENGSAVINIGFDIIPADLSEAVMSPIKAQTYSGSEIKPKAAFKLGKTSLKAGKDYEIVYKNNTGMGTADVIIHGIGNYTGTASGSFVINGAPISKAKVVLSPKTVMFSGEELNPITLTYGKGIVLIEGQDYEIHYVGDHTNAGKAFYWIEGKGDFEGTTMGSEAKPKNFKINPYDIKKNNSGDFAAEIIDGKPQVTFGEQKQLLIGSAAEKKDKTTDYAYSFKDKLNKSTGEITRTWTITGQKNLKGKVTIVQTLASE